MEHFQAAPPRLFPGDAEVAGKGGQVVENGKLRVKVVYLGDDAEQGLNLTGVSGQRL